MAAIGNLTELAARRLLRLYEAAERDIAQEISRALLRGNQTQYLYAMQQQVEAKLDELRRQTRTWVQAELPRLYSAGVNVANRELREAGIPIRTTFGHIHQQAVQVLADNSYDALIGMTNTIGRQVAGIYRTMGLESVRGSVFGYQAWKQASRNLRDQLAARGLTALRDRAGRQWNMTTYTDMVARTTTMEAHLAGTANRLLEHDIDLVKVNWHEGACPKCVHALRGGDRRVFSLTGQTPGYPLLDEARADGLFHPRCRHSYGAYIPGLGD